jgi:hypothetical protein
LVNINSTPGHVSFLKEKGMEKKREAIKNEKRTFVMVENSDVGDSIIKEWRYFGIFVHSSSPF